MTNPTTRLKRRITLPAVAGQVSLVVLSALLTGSCEGSLRQSGWLLGGKERRVVTVKPAEGVTVVQPTPSGAPAPAAPTAAKELSGANSRLPASPLPAVTIAGAPGGAPGGTKATPSADAESVIGTGKFLRDGGVAPRGAPASAGGVTLNFVDADIRDVVKTVIGGTLGQNFAIDPKVSGTMTLQTSKPIPRGAVLSTLESALALNGVSVVRSGAIYRVLPSSAAARNTVRPRASGIAGAAGEAYGVDILPLEFAAAGEMAKIIEPLVPGGAVIRTDTFRNMLVVGGTRHERESIADIVSIFDVDWMTGMSFALVPLQFAQPKQAIADLERIFGAGKGGPTEGLVRFFPVERRHAVLVVSAKPDMLDRSRDWIKRLDFGGEDEKRLYVYAVENTRATDLAAILGQVFSNAPIASSSGSLVPGRRLAQLSSPRNSSSSASGSSTGGIPTIGARSFEPLVNADQAAPVPGAPPSPPVVVVPGTVAGIAGNLPDTATARIIADDVNNALVVMAKPAEWRMIQEALRKLDVVPLQVMIEATIVEVTLTDDLRYGVQSFFKLGASRVTRSTGSSATIASTFPGFSYVYDHGDIRAILDALDSITSIRVVSSPQVLVLDHRTAELQVGDQVPITTQQSVSNTDPSAPTVNRVEFRDTGVVLRVTPRVNASGVVNLEIEQEESSAVATTTSNIDSPTIQQRKLRSTVIVNSGETVALGGLIRDTQSDGVSGVPILSRIPILGNLFSSTTESGKRTELLAFITPRVIHNQEESRAVTRDLRKTFKNASDLSPGRKR